MEKKQDTKQKFRIGLTIFGAVLVVLILGLLAIGGIYVINRYSDAEVKPAYKEVITENYQGIRELEVDVEAISLVIKHEGNNISLTHHEFIEVLLEEDELIIREKKKHWYERVEGKVVLTIPENFNFEEVSIEGGAGSVKIDGLAMRGFDLEFGAGKITLNNLTVTGSASIEGGSGSASITGGSYNNLEVSMDVGSLKMLTKLNGRNIIEAGIGSSDIKLIGKSSDYTIAVNKGLGDIIVGNYIAKDGDDFGQGAVKVAVVGGIGNSVIKFVDEQGKVVEDIYKY